MSTLVPGDPVWRRAQRDRLLAFARGSVTDVGFGWLQDDGSMRPGGARELWINARMTYVFARAGDHDLAAHGVRALLGPFRDPTYDGWFRTVDASAVGGLAPVDDTKACYEHAFVVLAGAAATDAGVEGGRTLLAAALAVNERWFWDEAAGRPRESWSRDWSTSESYRGANSTMHTVEAYLAAAASTGDDVWLRRSGSMTGRLLDVAREHDWRVVEHFDAEWHPLLEHHLDNPRDRFRPYGATPGHGFEWARLAVQMHDALAAQGLPEPGDLVADGRALFHRAADDSGGGATGFPYTTDWNGRPVVTERFHWVVCEAILAADALARACPDDERYAVRRDAWWALADAHFVDHEQGSWHHELSATLGPSQTTWVGRPDAYHAFNALTLP